MDPPEFQPTPHLGLVGYPLRPHGALRMGFAVWHPVYHYWVDWHSISEDPDINHPRSTGVDQTSHPSHRIDVKQISGKS